MVTSTPIDITAESAESAKAAAQEKRAAPSACTTALVVGFNAALVAFCIWAIKKNLS